MQPYCTVQGIMTQVGHAAAGVNMPVHIEETAKANLYKF